MIRHVLVQCSSRSWSGDSDDCMSLLNDHPIIFWTISHLKRILDAQITLIAPEFDKGGQLDKIAASFHNVRVIYSNNASPLLRLVEATKDLDGNEYVLRTNGLNMFMIGDQIMPMLRTAIENNLDIIKFEDDFPPQLGFEIYKVASFNAVQKAIDILPDAQRNIFHIHPRYFYYRTNLLKSAYVPSPSVDEGFIAQAREAYRLALNAPRNNIIESKYRIKEGDLLSHHYVIAIDFLRQGDKVLDVACGNGYGTNLLSQHCSHVVGADLDPDVIRSARSKSSGNVRFEIQDVTNTSFEDGQFDVVTSFETIEHVNDRAMLAEMKRITKPNGLLIISTPQNSIGKNPLHPHHLREYSLASLEALVSEFFLIERIIGFKTGTITFSDDPVGTNTMMVLKNSLQK